MTKSKVTVDDLPEGDNLLDRQPSEDEINKASCSNALKFLNKPGVAPAFMPETMQHHNAWRQSCNFLMLVSSGALACIPSKRLAEMEARLEAFEEQLKAKKDTPKPKPRQRKK